MAAEALTVVPLSGRDLETHLIEERCDVAIRCRHDGPDGPQSVINR